MYEEASNGLNNNGAVVALIATFLILVQIFSHFSCERGRRSLQLVTQSWSPMLTPAGVVLLTLWDRKYHNEDEILFTKSFVFLESSRRHIEAQDTNEG